MSDQLQLVRSRNNNSLNANNVQGFLRPPVDPAGRRVNVSDRLLICSSSARNEVVVGGSDHALYSIDVEDPRKKPITMYGKKSGHTDWVTTVAHLPNGAVLSGSMDGRICMWSASNRRECIELSTESTHPVSKIVADTTNNVAVSCCYDGNLTMWSFGSSSSSNTGPRAFTNRNGVNQPSSTVFYGHSQPVLECAFQGTTMISGDKGGSMMIWDMNRGEALHRFRAHPAAITAVEVLPDRNTFISCGTDGYVKIWDPRTGSGLVHKIPSHIKTVETTAPTAARKPVNNVRAIGGTVSGGGMSPETVGSRMVSRNEAYGGRGQSRIGSGAPTSSGPSGNVTTTSAISCLATVNSRGSSGGVNYIITGSGGGGDRSNGVDSSSLVVLDVRASHEIVSEWNHHRNGVYSLCVVGDECVFSGDGEGHLLCHNLLASSLHSPRECLKYGLGASEVGAVRSINCVNNKVITTGEDGCVMIYDYTQ